MKNKITNIVLTGGPCSGKTTAMAYLKQKIEEKGYIVLVVPESASLCINSGLNPINPIVGEKIGQTAIVDLGFAMESIWLDAATEICRNNNRPFVIFYDRGIPDASAYTSEYNYKLLLSETSSPRMRRLPHVVFLPVFWFRIVFLPVF